MIIKRRPDVDRFLSHPGREVCATLIWGRNRGGVHERADLLASKITARPDDPFDVALLTDNDIDADKARLADELCAQSMLGGRRMVRLRLSTEKESIDKAVAEAFKVHAEGGYNPDAFFLVEAGALDIRSALRKAAEKPEVTAVSIPVYEDEAGDLSRMVREAMSADRVGLTPEALDLFVGRLPKERGVARQEIERLILYLGPGSGTTAGPADLGPYLGVEPEASLFDAAFDAFGGRTGPTQAALRRAWADGESGPAAVIALGAHLGKLRRAHVATNAGANPETTAKSLKVFWKQEREFIRQMKSWRGSDFDQLHGEMLEADRACKSTGAPDRLIAERLALSISARARRMGL